MRVISSQTGSCDSFVSFRSVHEVAHFFGFAISNHNSGKSIYFRWLQSPTIPALFRYLIAEDPFRIEPHGLQTVGRGHVKGKYLSIPPLLSSSMSSVPCMRRQHGEGTALKCVRVNPAMDIRWDPERTQRNSICRCSARKP